MSNTHLTTRSRLQAWLTLGTSICRRTCSTTLTGAEHQQFALPSGRQLGYATYGPAASTTPPIFFFHGMPGSRLDGRYLDQVLPSLATTLRPLPQIISVERPGYGLSSPQANRQHLDFSRDVLALADELNIERFKVLGLSGGGPAALQCAHLVSPERLVGTGVWAGIGPVHAAGLRGYEFSLYSAFAIWLFQNRATRPMAHTLVRLMWRTPVQARGVKWAPYEESLRQALRTMPEGAMRDMYLEPVFADTVVGSLYETFRQGLNGYLPDADLVGQDWGFDLTELRGKKIRMFFGSRDDRTPMVMARWMSERIGGKETWRGYEEGKGRFETQECLLRVWSGRNHDLMLAREVREKILAEMVDL